MCIGDIIYVQDQNATDGRWFEGHVHFVRRAEVGLRFHDSFTTSYTAGHRFRVRFRLNRIPIRRQHQAIDMVLNNDERLLFPVARDLPNRPVPRYKDLTLTLYNPSIAGNPPQEQAVASIVSLRPGSPPFVVFGPYVRSNIDLTSSSECLCLRSPGTGKTMTIVEAILQLLWTNRQAKILVCAPSNSAADLIASRLRQHLKVTELFRFYAPSRFKDQVPDELHPYTYIRDDGHFSMPPMSTMTRFRVVVATCVSSSVVSGIGMPRGHFSHIFIDEAGQSTEPETFISIKTMADARTNVILSGDPKQLGPIIRSGIARQLGLEKSYLERLMDREVYNLRTYYGKRYLK